MTSIEFTPTQANFPLPTFDRLGLASDALLVAATQTAGGQEFVAVHTRPFAGEALNYFLNNCAAFGYSNTRRQHAQSVIEPLNAGILGPQASESDREFIKHEARLHHQAGEFGIGATMRAFERDVRQGWQEALDDPLTDSVYYPLLRTDVYTDIRQAAEWQVGEWKAQMPKQPVWWGAEAVHEVLMHIAPTEELGAIHKAYSENLAKAWQERDRDPDGSKKTYEKFGQDLSDYLDRFPQNARDDVIGRAYSQLPGARQGSANHTMANRLVVDLAGQRHWIEVPHAYDMKRGTTEGPLFPAPNVEFIDGTVQISDENGTAIKLNVHASGSATEPARWSIGDYSLPASHYTDGRYPAVAWQVDRSGERSFYDQTATVRAAHEAGLLVQGTPDAYLGKLLVKYFGQEDEYRPSDTEMKWLAEMGLPGSDHKQRITIRELPVWIQLPQHQADLLNSQFIKAAEAIAL